MCPSHFHLLQLKMIIQSEQLGFNVHLDLSCCCCWRRSEEEEMRMVCPVRSSDVLLAAVILLQLV